ncbi:MAG: terminase family protein [Hellea sp.]
MTAKLIPLLQALEVERGRRCEARADLLAFTQYTFSQYEAAPHHRRIARTLEAVDRGEIDRLMVTMPPRHGKSEEVTIRFPAWALGRNPKRHIITACYNAELASGFGRSVRNILATPAYDKIFQTQLARDSKAANRWNTTDGGAYIAAGVGTAITGRGADIFIIDDPLKDRAEAESELRRQAVWDWYTSTAYTRLMPGGAVIIVQTRWHEDDLAGRLLAHQEKGGDQWHRLDLPAIDASGQALWPEKYPLSALRRIQAAIGPRDWSALYQQAPSPEDGDFFRREWFDMFSELR